MDRDSSRLAGKTALITGAAKRIGRAVALRLAREGAHVVIHYRASAGEAQDVATQAKREGVNSWTIQADLAEPAQADALLPKAIETAGPIQILINNASIFAESRMMELTLDELAENTQVNAAAPLLISRAFAAQQIEGAIVNFLDSRIVEYDAKHVAYHLSKRMLFSLTRMMALEFAPRIRVNGVGPGLILPPFGKNETFLARLASTNPLNRVGTVEAVTDAALFLLTCDFVTGQVIFVDGGRHLKGCVYG